MLRKLLNRILEKRKILSMILGIAAILLLAFSSSSQEAFSQVTYSKLYIKIIGCIAGLMNLLEGLYQIRASKNRSLGMTTVMTGIILIVLGFLIPELFM